MNAVTSSARIDAKELSVPLSDMPRESDNFHWRKRVHLRDGPSSESSVTMDKPYVCLMECFNLSKHADTSALSSDIFWISASLIENLFSHMLGGMFCALDRKGRVTSLDVEDTLLFTPRRLITLPLQTAFKLWLSCMVMMSGVKEMGMGYCCLYNDLPVLTASALRSQNSTQATRT